MSGTVGGGYAFFAVYFLVLTLYFMVAFSLSLSLFMKAVYMQSCPVRNEWEKRACLFCGVGTHGRISADERSVFRAPRHLLRPFAGVFVPLSLTPLRSPRRQCLETGRPSSGPRRQPVPLGSAPVRPPHRWHIPPRPSGAQRRRQVRPRLPFPKNPAPPL